jgi:ferredoxin/nitrate reductase gamma subunit
MSHIADPQLLSELKKYGKVNIELCFNCGNCTAVCPLSNGEDNFPRRMIRYTQIGMKEKLLGSKELWLCYNCGECTTTCPHQADPGEFMAAVRRYAIAKYDIFGLARILFTSPILSMLLLIVLAAVLGLFIYSFHGPMPGDNLRLFEFIPSEMIHNFGVLSGIIIALVSLAGITNMTISISKEKKIPKDTRLNWLMAMWDTIVVEVLEQRRYRKDCEKYSQEQHWYKQKWFIHASIMWGFLGLFLATVLDYLLELLGIKPIGTWVPIWYPVRLLGTLAGVLMMYGVSAAIIRRWRKVDETSSYSTPSDWAFLILLWLSGITGFILEISIYLPQPHTWSYLTLLVHLIAVGELLILLPFSKFAHAIYRTTALYIYALKPLSKVEPASAGIRE